MQDHLFATGTGADLTPPQVVSTNPPSGATGVGTNVVLQATFDRPTDPLLVGGASVYLRTNSSGTPVSTVLNISQDSKSITLTPSQPLQSATYFYFEVDVFDLAGNELNTYYPFTTQ